MVGADVGELLDPHVRHLAGQGREDERHQLGDAAGVDAGSVQSDADLGRARQPVVAGHRVEPADGRHHVLARPQQRFDLVRVGQERRVEHAVRVESEDCVPVVGCRDPDRLSTEDSPTSWPAFSDECTQQPTSRGRDGRGRPQCSPVRPHPSPIGSRGRAGSALLLMARRREHVPRSRRPPGQLKSTSGASADPTLQPRCHRDASDTRQPGLQTSVRGVYGIDLHPPGVVTNSAHERAGA